MPIYEYACGSCGIRVEVLQGINDLPLTECQQCHKPTLEKLVSIPLFRLKGSGWYETDFKKENDKKRNLANNEESLPPVKSENGGETSSSTSTISKSETAE